MNSLHAKLSVALLIIFCVIGILLVGIISWSSERYYEEVTQELNASIPMYVLESSDAKPKLIENGVINKAAFRVLSNRVMVINPSVELYLLKPNGEILDASVPKELLRKNQVNIEAINQYLSDDRKFPLKGDDPLHLDQEKIFSVAAINNKDGLQGYLYTIFGGRQYDSLIFNVRWKYLTQVGGVAILCILLFAFMTAVITFGVLTKRLETLSHNMQVFKDNKFIKPPETATLKLNENKQDEIDKLHVSFVEMAETITSQLEADKKMDSLRRELISNVSHDLRTPISLIRSYIETLLVNKGDLKNIEKDQFLSIVIKHSQYLSQLVDQLCELSHLESNIIKLDKSSFSLSNLIRDVIKSFKIITDEKNLKVKFQLYTKGKNYIFADKSLIERVLTNLIDNSMSHTPDGGLIIIKLRHSSDKSIGVTIKDNGKGIPKEQLPYIFDRYFQIKNMNSEEKQGLGLGLAISKKIIELHNSIITVDSEEFVGTQFEFDLPVDVKNESALIESEQELAI